ncbi:Permeases of the major facilitator superfamily [Candidatus Paraburkholderia kirkii UZHbot1]|uniref:Permeases of the major facilitator superfamily n=1 Tax=Candidatus Paraburkholderia kirkii UZHbot1 TaxID=1055526 RepID=G4MBR1_9BURK|nr:Permeases of the major facilitator superfamily [Candidatus Paraburkholderia kirkii UZHbot1]
MNALPNTRDAIGDSWTSTSRRARRIARHGHEAAEDIGSELRSLLNELESTLAEGTSADAAALRAQVSERLDSARARLNDTQAALRQRAGAVFDDADAYIHEKPWQTIVLVGGLALVAGVLLTRVR